MNKQQLNTIYSGRQHIQVKDASGRKTVPVWVFFLFFWEGEFDLN
jgi:hypothetical protein